MSAAIGAIEELVGRTVRRDISRLAAFARGNLQEAARSIATQPAPHVGIVAGFFVRHAEPPSPETDGLNGMGQLAAGLLEAGVPVTLISDAPCAKAVWAVSRTLPGTAALEIVSIDAGSVRSLRQRLESAAHPPTHIVAIERCALAADGKAHREHGWDISEDTAPLDLLFEDAGWTPKWTTIGIGDGGNEIGMGVLPKELVESDIPNGSLIAAKTRADFLIVAAVANWGAYGLLASIAILRPDLAPSLLKHFNGKTEEEILSAAVNLGQAIDDSRVDRLGQLQMTIDRLPLARHIAMVDEIASLASASNN
jgi:D-glutamate cyclase